MNSQSSPHAKGEWRHFRRVSEDVTQERQIAVKVGGVGDTEKQQAGGEGGATTPSPAHALAFWHAARSWSSKPGSQYAARRWERRDTLSPSSGCRTRRRQESRRQTAGASPQDLALCCDATLVSPITGASAPHPRADHTPGIALRMAESRKRATYPELQRGGGQRLFVLAVEVGGRWNADSQALVRQLPPPVPGRVGGGACCRLQCSTLLAARRWEYRGWSPKAPLGASLP